jgi:hypothetical protein
MASMWAAYRSGAQAVERGLQDRLHVVGIAVELGDGNDQVKDLLEREVVADLVSVQVRGDEVHARMARDEHEPPDRHPMGARLWPCLIQRTADTGSAGVQRANTV